MYFYNDYTYSEEYNKNKMMYFKLVDISTIKKGPVYTITKSESQFDKNMGEFNLFIDVSYGALDVPIDLDSSFVTIIDVKDESSKYSIYPLIYQMAACDYYIEEQLPFSRDTVLKIIDITIINGDFRLSLNETKSEKKIMKVFKNLDMLTSVNTILDDNQIIILNKDGTWEFDKLDLQDKTQFYTEKKKKIIIPVRYSETVYVLDSKLMHKMVQIENLDVCYIYRQENEEYENYKNIYNGSNINEILETCLFLPQIISIEKLLYKLDVTIEIIITINGKDITVRLDENETNCEENLCFFDIIKRILDIMEDI